MFLNSRVGFMKCGKYQTKENKACVENFTMKDTPAAFWHKNSLWKN